MCGEYGDDLGRPHYHALLFGFDFPDKKLFKQVRGNPLYLSESLTRIWGLGHATIGDVTFKSAAYVARYVLKKINGDRAKAHYEKVDESTGEIRHVLPEYTKMSLKKGIAEKWFNEYKWDIYPDDYAVIEGKKYKTPRYYDKLIKRSDGAEYLEVIKAVRVEHANKVASNATSKRLAAREQVQEAKAKLLRRNLHEVGNVLDV